MTDHKPILRIVEALALSVMALVSLVVLYFVMSDRSLARSQAASSVKPSPSAPVQPTWRSMDPTFLEVDTKVFNALGSSAAEAVMVEFSDFQCPYCAKYAQETFPTLKTKLIDTGKLRYVFVNFPLESVHPDAFGAAVAGQCAGRQDSFWEMHDRLFGNQLDRASLVRYADLIKLDRPSFEKCLETEVDAVVRGHIQKGFQLSVRSTPTFFLGVAKKNGTELRRRSSGVQSFDALEAEISKLNVAAN